MAVAAPARGRSARHRGPPPERAAPGAAPAAAAAASPGASSGSSLVAVLLVGIVALNVAALQLNLESQRLEEQKEKLLGENAATASELSSLAASARIEQVAREELGLVEPAQITYVRIRDGRR